MPFSSYRSWLPRESGEWAHRDLANAGGTVSTLPVPFLGEGSPSTVPVFGVCGPPSGCSHRRKQTHIFTPRMFVASRGTLQELLNTIQPEARSTKHQRNNPPPRRHLHPQQHDSLLARQQLSVLNTRPPVFLLASSFIFPNKTDFPSNLKQAWYPILHTCPYTHIFWQRPWQHATMDKKKHQRLAQRTLACTQDTSELLSMIKNCPYYFTAV